MTTLKEIWKDLKDYEGIYTISNYGKIKNKHGELVEGWKVNINYIKVRLYKNKQSKDYYMHRLVAFNFLIPVDGKNCVNHIDCNPSNNMVTNLEWCTHAENMHHAKINKRFNTIGKKILHTKSNKEYKSIAEAALEFNIARNTLVYRLRRNSKNCEFKYI
jgi:hypothetical protein